jgi:hypothetical protein
VERTKRRVTVIRQEDRRLKSEWVTGSQRLIKKINPRRNEYEFHV